MSAESDCFSPYTVKDPQTDYETSMYEHTSPKPARKLRNSHSPEDFYINTIHE